MYLYLSLGRTTEPHFTVLPSSHSLKASFLQWHKTRLPLSTAPSSQKLHHELIASARYPISLFSHAPIPFYSQCTLFTITHIFGPMRFFSYFETSTLLGYLFLIHTRIGGFPHENNSPARFVDQSFLTNQECNFFGLRPLISSSSPSRVRCAFGAYSCHDNTRLPRTAHPIAWRRGFG